MNNDGRDNKSLENLVDVILTKIAEELTGSRDKYLEYVMAEKGDGEWSSRDGSGFSGQGFNGQGFNGQGFNGQGFTGQGFNGNPPNPKGKKLGTVTKVIIGIIIAVLVLTLPILIALGLYSAKPDSNRIEESNIDEGAAIEEQEALDSEETTETTESDDSESEENNPNIAAMASLMEEEPDVRMEYVDCIIRDMEYGEDNSVREVTLVLKNTGNRVISDLGVSFTGVNEYDSPGGIGAFTAVLPGQYIMLNGEVTDLSTEYLELGTIADGSYTAPWSFDEIPLENVPAKISVQEAMDESKELDDYPKAEINLMDGSVDNSLVGSDIGLEIAEIKVQNNHACVEIKNNTEYTIEEARVVLSILDKNGNIISSGHLLNYEGSIPPGETATEYEPLMPGEYIVPMFCDYTCDAEQDELKFGMTYLKVIPRAVGH